MSINADSVTPDPIDVIETAPKALEAAVPLSVPGVSAKMTEIAASGVMLSKFVLWIVVGTIGLLTLYLVTTDALIGFNVESIYHKVNSVGAVGAEFETLEAIDKFRLALVSTETDPAIQFSAEDIKNAEMLSAAVALLPSIPEEQRATLRGCSPPPAGTGRKMTIDRCLGLLDRIREGLLDQSSSAAHSQAASDAANKIGEQRKEFHSFWIQAAQLVLLNLLLPLLTALFGYVFGTQQAQK